MRVKFSMNFYGANGILYEARSEGQPIVHSVPDSMALPPGTYDADTGELITNHDEESRRRVAPELVEAAEASTFSEITESMANADPILGEKVKTAK